MKCKKCGNEISNGEKFCGKCGTKVEINNSNENINVNKNKIRNIKPAYVVVGVIVIIFIISICVTINNNKSSTITSADNGSSTTTTNSVQKKEYYDFIDKEYGTFNFTEDEFVKNIMSAIGNSSSYTAQGFQRNQSTVPNQYNYYKMAGGNTNDMNITINPNNNKVSKIKIGIIGKNLNDNDYEEYIINIVSNIVCRNYENRYK